ncbi:AMP-binding protein [Nocardia arthritidis]|uniref:AMP-binding protein n=1 Tax=Nocardia arthritidis TaxID=228602 RepID=A0A6G9Y8H7_9NOCA|nr:AMP-binding protein [Nocardia arthritidis]QIS09363.1 AMP-binding protein [Nocardia arthritidis]
MSDEVTDVINAISRNQSRDTKHRIHYVIDGQPHSLTLAELDAKAIKVAHRLRELGVGPRDRVGIISPNRIEWVLLDLAVLKLGAVIAPFESDRFDPEKVGGDFGLAVVFAERAADSGDVLPMTTIAEWADGPEGEPLQPHSGYDPADICAIKFTSGSTGTPKGLEATVVSINSDITAVQEMFHHTDGDNLLSFMGMWFLQQRYWVYSALMYGHDITISTYEAALEVAALTAPTVVMGVPGFYEELLERLETTGPTADLDKRRERIQQELGGRVRYLWTGSAPPRRALLDFFNDCGVPLYEGYGLTEVCIVAKNHPGAVRLGSVGKLLPGKTVRIAADGTMIFGSSHPVNIRYTWAAPHVNEQTFLPTGEVKTSDIGYLDEDGFLFVRGRLDEAFSLTTGRTVYVRTIEERLRAHPDIHECVLYGADRSYLTVIISPAVPDPDHAALRRFIVECNEGVPHEERVHAVVLAPERFSIQNGLLTMQLKLRRRDIHARFANELAAVYREPDPGPADPLLIVAE